MTVYGAGGAAEVQVDGRRPRRAGDGRRFRQAARVSPEKLNLHGQPGRRPSPGLKFGDMTREDVLGGNGVTDAQELGHGKRKRPRRPLERPHRCVGHPLHWGKNQGGHGRREHGENHHSSPRGPRTVKGRETLYGPGAGTTANGASWHAPGRAIDAARIRRSAGAVVGEVFALEARDGSGTRRRIDQNGDGAEVA
jgi:hypothetical protein